MFDPYALTDISYSWERVKLRVRDTYYKFKYPIRIVVVWPTGEVTVGPSSRNHDGVSGGTWYQLVESSDPNDHYRPELEKNVGRQGIDWKWDISKYNYDKIEIMFKKRYEKMAVYYQLKWG